MNHQDWTTTVIYNKDKQVKTKQIVEKKGDTSINDELRKIENSTESFSHQKIPNMLTKELINARINLKLTQKDMANKLNIQQNIYTELENGKAIYSSQNKQIVNKIERVLGIKFEHKNVIKVNKEI